MSTEGISNSTSQPAGVESSQRINQPILEWDGLTWKQLFRAGMTWLEKHTAAINALNVFPVPDGDTGTNMYLTLQAAWEEIAHNVDSSIPAIAQRIAHGALMGARGNSGVILSQLFRGIAQAMENARSIDAALFAQALQQASITAYKAVIRPVEGTILTVARKAAEAGVTAAKHIADLRELLAYVVEAASQAVADTPSQLPVLAEAGVVDAGGQGLYIFLEGMLRYVQGDTMMGEISTEGSLDLRHPESPEEGYGYDVQFLLQGENLDVAQIRADIDAMGTSTLVVGDSHVIKVHVHTQEPGSPLNYAARLGTLSRITVENLQEQYQEFVKRQAPPPPVARKPAATQIAIVAVVPGAGLAKVYESLGATMIVPGGQTMNPSTESILKAIESVDAREIIILPNNKNVILTAQQAQKLSDRQVRVVPSKSIPQGISALLAFNYQADLDTNAQVMEEALTAVQTGEVTRAVRSVKINGIEVGEGQLIGLLNGDLVAAGDDYAEVILQLLHKMHAENLEIITLYYGEGVSEEEAQALAADISKRYPDQEIEVVQGDQPHYPYIISAE